MLDKDTIQEKLDQRKDLLDLARSRVGFGPTDESRLLGQVEALQWVLDEGEV